MRLFKGKVLSIQIDSSGNSTTCIECPAAAIPAPGQYLRAWSPAEVETPLATMVFPTKLEAQRFWSNASMPNPWEPGTELFLHGPLGHGFESPTRVLKFAFVSIDSSPGRLMPLIHAALSNSCDAVICSDHQLLDIPPVIEVYPLNELPEISTWAEAIMIDTPLSELDQVKKVLGHPGSERVLPPTQVLVVAPMPCGGTGECGACAVPGRRGYKLACKDGPVFNLQDILR